MRITVHYEMYDGIPVLRKWISVNTEGPGTVMVNTLVYEMLRAPNFAPERLSLVVQQESFPIRVRVRVIVI